MSLSLEALLRAAEHQAVMGTENTRRVNQSHGPLIVVQKDYNIILCYKNNVLKTLIEMYSC